MPCRIREAVRTSLLLLLALVATLEAQAPTVGRDCVISWELPTTNVDGTPLTDLSHVWLYAKTEREQPYPSAPLGKFPPSVTSTTCQAARLTGPQYFVMVRGVDTQGNVGPESNELALVLDAQVPAAITTLKAMVTTTESHTTTTTTTTVVSP